MTRKRNPNWRLREWRICSSRCCKQNVYPRSGMRGNFVGCARFNNALRAALATMNNRQASPNSLPDVVCMQQRCALPLMSSGPLVFLRPTARWRWWHSSRRWRRAELVAGGTSVGARSYAPGRLSESVRHYAQVEMQAQELILAVKRIPFRSFQKLIFWFKK